MRVYRFILPTAAILASFGIVLTLGCVAACADDDLPPEGRFVRVNGMEMYYEIHGEGEPLVLLHGFFGNGQFWMPFLPALAKEYRVIVPDLRNHGRTTNPSRTFTHRLAATDVFALLDKLEIRRFRAMGFSTGGMTLLHMATSQPDRVRAMVLFGASSYLPTAARNHRELTFKDFCENPKLVLLKNQHPRGEGQTKELIQLWHNFEDNYDDMNFTPPYLSTIKASTLIVHGDRDKFFPVSIAVKMYESIPDSYLWIQPNGGHRPNIEKPERFQEPLQDFLRGDWGKNNTPR